MIPTQEERMEQNIYKLNNKILTSEKEKRKSK